MSFIFPSNEILKCYGVTALWRQSWLRGKSTLIWKNISIDKMSIIQVQVPSTFIKKKKRGCPSRMASLYLN